MNPQSIEDIVPLDDFKAHCVAKTLLHTKGNKVKAGLILNITQVTLFSYLKRFRVRWVERWFTVREPRRQLRDCFEYQTVGGETRLVVGERLDNDKKKRFKG
tara:strand:+ start:274 stop:579 length:306 start_codon:yes stop_codon:yes gene_type:complete